MGGIIFCFSQTENTKKSAQAIHGGMRQVVEECDIAAFVLTVKPLDLKLKIGLFQD